MESQAAHTHPKNNQVSHNSLRVHFVVDLEHIHLTGARIRRIFVQEECLGCSISFMSVLWKAHFLHCKEVCEYVLIPKITLIPKGSKLFGQYRFVNNTCKMLELFNFSVWPTTVSIPRHQGAFPWLWRWAPTSSLGTRLTVSVKRSPLTKLYSLESC